MKQDRFDAWVNHVNYMSNLPPPEIPVTNPEITDVEQK